MTCVCREDAKQEPLQEDAGTNNGNPSVSLLPVSAFTPSLRLSCILFYSLCEFVLQSGEYFVCLDSIVSVVI